MSLDTIFKQGCKDLKLDNLDDIEKSVGEIVKKLNNYYYEKENDSTSNLYIIGSVGRKTAIKNISDIDIIFNLPNEIYEQFNNHENNGQSQLLQAVKEVLLKKYPRTDIRGDGQVVIISFDKFTIEILPAFKQSDDSFKYPDTHDGGSWKITKPLLEIEASKECNKSTQGIFLDFCRILRAWKNKIGFLFSGLLIDTLVYNYAKEKYTEDKDYFQILKELLIYLSLQNKEQQYWYALGSNQRVKNKGDNKFIQKATQAIEKIHKAEENNEDINKVLVELLGRLFASKSATQSKGSYSIEYTDTEEFIEDKFSINIKYFLSIDCEVSQNGYRPHFLRWFITENNNNKLKINKQLRFFIKDTNCLCPYDIYWKVRNVGIEAEKRDMIRGQITKTNKDYQQEKTNFVGAHYVECFLVKNNICVARDKIEVPIGNY